MGFRNSAPSQVAKWAQPCGSERPPDLTWARRALGGADQASQACDERPSSEQARTPHFSDVFRGRRELPERRGEPHACLQGSLRVSPRPLCTCPRPVPA